MAYYNFDIWHVGEILQSKLIMLLRFLVLGIVMSYVISAKKIEEQLLCKWENSL